MQYWTECGKFLRECRHHFRSTGALLPSSWFLARSLVSELRKPRGPARILEVGPGTGSVTQEILHFMQPGDRLDAVEINAGFVDVLRRRFEREWRFRRWRDQVEIIHAAVQDLIEVKAYDFIISGLPLNNFPVGEVREVFSTFNRLLRPTGVLSYYEYVLIRQLTTPFVGPRERRRLLRLGRVIGHYIRTHQVRRERIFMNVPPAVVRHLRFSPACARRPIELPRISS